MRKRRATSFPKPRQAVIIGDNSQVIPTACLFAGGGVKVIVYTASSLIEENLAPYSDIKTIRVRSYKDERNDLPEAPYFICIDDIEIAQIIKAWLPPVIFIFHIGEEETRRSKTNTMLHLPHSDKKFKKQLFRRLNILKRVNRLIEMARNTELPLILIYGDPDPDAISSAFALSYIWKSAGAKPIIRYTGEIKRYQNKQLISYIKEPIEKINEYELEGADLIATVDAQPSFWKENPPNAHIVIDHHPKVVEPSASFVDIREHYGSAATILTEYLLDAELPISKTLATALLYGLTTDTDNLCRNTTKSDISVYSKLYPLSDQSFIGSLNRSQVPMNMLEYIAWGMLNRIVINDIMLVHFGEINNPDILVQSADLLLLTCGINCSICAGKINDKLVVVFRGDGHRQNVGNKAKNAFNKIGSAGGHKTMGRAEIPLEGKGINSTIPIITDNLFKRLSSARKKELTKNLQDLLSNQSPSEIAHPIKM